MSGIAGIVSLKGAALRYAPLADRMIAAMPRRNTDGISSWGDRFFQLRHAWMNTTGSADFAVIRHGDDALVLIGDLRLDNRADLIDALGLTARVSDAAIALHAFRRWRTEAPAYMLGDFAFAVWDSAAQELVCVRDHLGVRPFHYSEGRDELFFASDIGPILLSGAKNVVEDEYISNVLAGIPPPPRNTPFPNVKRLEAGHVLTFSRRGLAVRQYWSPHAVAPDRAGSNVEHFQSLFRAAIRDRLRGPASTGALLSGGLDSSSICSVISAETQTGGCKNIRTLSATFPGQSELDEMSYINAVLQKPGFSPSFVEMSPDEAFAQFDKVIAQQGGVPIAAGLTVVQRLYQAASAQGVRVLLDGHGGDEVVSHGDRRMYQLAAEGRWLSLWRETRGAARVHGKPMTMTFLRLFDHYAMGGRAARIMSTGRPHRGGGPQQWLGFVQDEFARRTAIGERARQYFAMPGASAVDDRAYHLWRMSAHLVPHSLETLNKLGAAAGLEVRMPFFDRRLVEFCLSLPGEERIHRGWSRYILRRAMDGILPAKVQWRAGKIDFMPNLIRGMVRTRPAFEGFLIDGSPIARFVDLGKVRNAMDQLAAAPDKSDPYEVNFLWRTVALAYWLQNAEQSP